MQQIQFIESSDIPLELDIYFRDLTHDVGVHDQDHILQIDKEDHEDNKFVQWLVDNKSFQFNTDHNLTYLAIKGI